MPAMYNTAGNQTHTHTHTHTWANTSSFHLQRSIKGIIIKEVQEWKKNRRTLITKKKSQAGSRWQRCWQPRSAGAPSVFVCVCVCVCVVNSTCDARCSHTLAARFDSPPVEQADLAFRWLLEVLPRWHIALSDFHSSPSASRSAPYIHPVSCTLFASRSECVRFPNKRLVCAAGRIR